MNASNVPNTLVSIDRAEAQGERARLSSEQAATLDRASLRLMNGDGTATAAVSHILNKRLRLPLYRFDAACSAVESLAAKARKRGLPEPLLTELSREEIADGDDEPITWVTVRLLGAAPVMQGWSLAAAMATTRSSDDEPIVSFFAAHGAALSQGAEDYKARSSDCDHCKRRIRRNLTYVVKHEDGREALVGSSCVDEYLGTDALQAWFVFSRLHELEGELRGWGSFDRAEYDAWRAEHAAKTGAASRRSEGANTVAVPLADFLALACAEIDACGYVTSAAAYSDGGTPTGRKIYAAYQNATHVAPTPAHVTEAQAILAWLDSDVRGTYAFDAYDEPTYLTNLADYFADAEEHGVNERRANMLASAVGSYRREAARRDAQKELLNEHLPNCEESDRIVLTELTVTRSMGWGVSCLDADKRTVFVQTGRYASDDATVQAGDKIQVVGTIRDFSYYRDTAQTRLNRAKIYRAGEELTAAHRSTMRKWATLRGFDCPAWAAKKTRKRVK